MRENFQHSTLMITNLFLKGRSQAVRLPKELRMPGRRVSLRRLGAGVLIEPAGAVAWPEGFFEAIRITDAAFTRPEQGETPAIVALEP